MHNVIYIYILQHSVFNSYFIFNEKYLQIEGLASAFRLANGYHEDICLTLIPTICWRFLKLFRQRLHANFFLNYLNSKHNNIKFTSECEIDNSLSFIDAKVSRHDNKWITSVYRKSTFTGLGNSFFSFEYLNSSWIELRLLFWAYNIIFYFANLHDEIIFHTEFFKCNSYPGTLLNSHIQKFLSA